MRPASRSTSGQRWQVAFPASPTCFVPRPAFSLYTLPAIPHITHRRAERRAASRRIPPVAAARQQPARALRTTHGRAGMRTRGTAARRGSRQGARGDGRRRPDVPTPVAPGSFQRGSGGYNATPQRAERTHTGGTRVTARWWRWRLRLSRRRNTISYYRLDIIAICVSTPTLQHAAQRAFNLYPGRAFRANTGTLATYFHNAACLPHMRAHTPPPPSRGRHMRAGGSVGAPPLVRHREQTAFSRRTGRAVLTTISSAAGLLPSRVPANGKLLRHI